MARRLVGGRGQMRVGFRNSDIDDRSINCKTKYVVEHKSGEGGYLFEQGKPTNAQITLGPICLPPLDKYSEKSLLAPSHS